MSSSYGENLRITIFGQSHAPAVGVTMEGIPAGEPVDLVALQRFLDRRAPGQNDWSTPRREEDKPEILCGLQNGVTCGAPLTAVIRNTNTRSGDYAALRRRPRPGHADYTAEVKYFGAQDAAGGGHFSGRLTAPLCIAGGICLQLLSREGIAVIGRIAAIAGVADEGALTGSTADKPFPTVSDARGEQMRAAIAAARAEGDSVGGIIEWCWGFPPGSATRCSAAWKTALPPPCSAFPPSRALSSARASPPPRCAAARITTPSPSRTAKSSRKRTAAAAF